MQSDQFLLLTGVFLYLIMCLVSQCKENHSSHYCKYCGNKNSNHFSSTCPELFIIAYHGTDKQSANLIKNSGFLPSKNGRMGPGVYFTPDFQIAKNVALLRQKQKKLQPAVLMCKITKTYVTKFWFFWQKKHDTFNTGTHPSWQGVTQKPFEQILVKNQYIKQINVLSVINIQKKRSLNFIPFILILLILFWFFFWPSNHKL